MTPEEWETREVALHEAKLALTTTTVNPVLKLRRLSEMKTPPATKWLGRGWLPRSEITVLVGEEGIGKSLFWVRMAANITTGRADKSINMPARKPADVVVIVTEDSTGEVLARLKLAGADIDRVFVFSAEEDGSGNPVFGNAMNGDMLTLDAMLSQESIEPALVVVDAWVDTVSGSLTLKDSQQARQAMHPWKILAQRHNVAVLLLTHTNRLNTANTRDLMGSTAVLRQKARMVLFAARARTDRESSMQHLWVGPDKSNVTGIANALKFNVTVEQVRAQSDDDPGTTAHLTAPSDACMTIRDLIGEWKREEIEAERKPTRKDSVREELVSYVTSRGGTVPSKELTAHLEGLGFGKSSIEQAKKECGHTAKSGFGGAWVFSLPSQSTDQLTSGSITNGISAFSAFSENDANSAVEDPILPKPTNSLSSSELSSELTCPLHPTPKPNICFTCDQLRTAA
ncbi:AAA family ATPase [Arthrobacter sp. NPDC093125]|uniref:AAA family ATPase n=1 Tax=Arthrobacter sp. NPDC093125 TaxID=3363944 RepID=UPI00380116CA